ncbi:hypothetical protein IAR55_007148 [Kwoniella newhampshirensis]|uniref:Uncharacterized protein n=1 Tax=Kwoniella newhampshirensis TaxID=1651941 RepID=A0AAW0YHV7_9TREE
MKLSLRLPLLVSLISLSSYPLLATAQSLMPTAVGRRSSLPTSSPEYLSSILSYQSQTRSRTRKTSKQDTSEDLLIMPPRRDAEAGMKTQMESSRANSFLSSLEDMDVASGNDAGLGEKDQLGPYATSKQRDEGMIKIIGVGHEADGLPLSNGERMKLGLPLKPPKLQ